MDPNTMNMLLQQMDDIREKMAAGWCILLDMCNLQKRLENHIYPYYEPTGKLLEDVKILRAAHDKLCDDIAEWKRAQGHCGCGPGGCDVRRIVDMMRADSAL